MSSAPRGYRCRCYAGVDEVKSLLRPSVTLMQRQFPLRTDHGNQDPEVIPSHISSQFYATKESCDDCEERHCYKGPNDGIDGRPLVLVATCRRRHCSLGANFLGPYKRSREARGDAETGRRTAVFMQRGPYLSNYATWSWNLRV